MYTGMLEWANRVVLRETYIGQALEDDADRLGQLCPRHHQRLQSPEAKQIDRSARQFSPVAALLELSLNEARVMEIVHVRAAGGARQLAEPRLAMAGTGEVFERH